VRAVRKRLPRSRSVRRRAAAARTSLPRVPKAGRALHQPFIMLTGLSGSGKSQAIRALEDLGYFCVDNLPTTLIPTLAKLSLRDGGVEKVAIVVDVRERNFLSQFPRIFNRLRTMRGLNPVLIFLEASNAALVRRFSETRRPHPLARGRSVTEGIRDERSRMAAIRGLADEIIDTSDMTVHELRQFFMGLSRGGRAGGRLVITLLSFGYKHGVPVDADLVFDARCLPNPHFVPALRRRTGRDSAVVTFMERDASTVEFIAKLEDYLRHVIPYYIAEGKSYLTVAIGCTGGRHRSVMIAERLRRALAGIGGRLRVRHRDIAQS
jgi:RNase adapter protein RapZ